MSNLLKVFLIAASLVLSACMTSVLEKTDNTAIIKGVASSHAEAELKAIRQGRELFGEVEKTRRSECTQELNVNAGTTYWQCIVFLKRR